MWIVVDLVALCIKVVDLITENLVAVELVDANLVAVNLVAANTVDHIAVNNDVNGILRINAVVKFC